MNPLVGTVISLTDRVQSAIDSGDWPLAQELETERREQLMRLAAAPDTTGEIARTFTSLLERNRRMIGLVEHHKRRVLREAAVARTAHDGAVAYADNAEPGSAVYTGA
jgi:hypothetical protein